MWIYTLRSIAPHGINGSNQTDSHTPHSTSLLLLWVGLNKPYLIAGHIRKNTSDQTDSRTHRHHEKPYPALAYRWHNNGPPMDAHANYGQSTMAKLRRHNHQRACPTPPGRERHPDAPRHHRTTQLYVIFNLKMTLICEACNWTFQTRYQYDKHLKLNHLEQQYRCYHCQKKTFALRKIESRTPPLRTTTHRQSHFRRGSSPQAMFGHRWNPTKLTPLPMSTRPSKILKLPDCPPLGNTRTGTPM